MGFENPKSKSRDLYARKHAGCLGGNGPTQQSVPLSGLAVGETVQSKGVFLRQAIARECSLCTERKGRVIYVSA